MLKKTFLSFFVIFRRFSSFFDSFSHFCQFSNWQISFFLAWYFSRHFTVHFPYQTFSVPVLTIFAFGHANHNLRFKKRHYFSKKCDASLLRSLIPIMQTSRNIKSKIANGMNLLLSWKLANNYFNFYVEAITY